MCKALRGPDQGTAQVERRKRKLLIGANIIWGSRGWQLVLPSLLHVTLICYGVKKKKPTPKCSSLKPHWFSDHSWFPWVGNSGLAWLGGSSQVSNAVRVRVAGTVRGWSTGAARSFSLRAVSGVLRVYPHGLVVSSSQHGSLRTLGLLRGRRPQHEHPKGSRWTCVAYLWLILGSHTVSLFQALWSKQSQRPAQVGGEKS